MAAESRWVAAVVVAEPGPGRVELGRRGDVGDLSAGQRGDLVDVPRPVGLGPAGHGQQVPPGAGGRGGVPEGREDGGHRGVQVGPPLLGDQPGEDGGQDALGHREDVVGPRSAQVLVDHDPALDPDVQCGGVGVARVGGDIVEHPAGGDADLGEVDHAADSWMGSVRSERAGEKYSQHQDGNSSSALTSRAGRSPMVSPSRPPSRAPSGTNPYVRTR